MADKVKEDSPKEILVESRRAFIKRTGAVGAILASMGGVLGALRGAYQASHGGETPNGFGRVLDYMYKSEATNPESYVKTITGPIAKGMIEHPESFDPNRKDLYFLFYFKGEFGTEALISTLTPTGESEFDLPSSILSEMGTKDNYVVTSDKEEKISWINKIEEAGVELASPKLSLLETIFISLDGKPVKVSELPELTSELKKYAVDKNIFNDQYLQFTVNDMLEMPVRNGQVKSKSFIRYYSLQTANPKYNAIVNLVIFSYDFETKRVSVDCNGDMFDQKALDKDRQSLYKKGSEAVLKAAAK